MILEILYTIFLCATFFFVMRKEIIQRECQFICLYIVYIYKKANVSFKNIWKMYSKCIRSRIENFVCVCEWMDYI